MNKFMMRMFDVVSSLASGAGDSSASENSLRDMSVGDNIALFFKSMGKKIGTWFVTMLFNLFYFISKLILNIVDFLGIAVKELAGQNAVEDLANIKNATEVDMVFRFVFNSSVWKIFKAFIGLGIVLLIVFAIVAILKTEYDSFLNGAEDNSKRQILVRSLSSIFLIVIIPFIAFGGILLSNSVLKSVDNALGGRSQNSTIASEVFIASTYESNMYRKYADAGARIPITFDFKTADKDSMTLPDAGENNSTMNSTMQEYLNRSEWKRGVYTWWQFYNNIFFSFAEVAKEAQTTDNSGETVTWNSFFDKNMSVYLSDYYVMADVVDYLVRSREDLYVVNAFELAKQIGLNDGVSGSDSPFWGYVATKDTNGEVVKDGQGNIVYEPTTDIEKADKLELKVYVNSKVAEEIPGVLQDGKRFYLSYEFNNSRSESLGAVYLLCTKHEKVNENGSIEFEYQLFRNYKERVNNYSGKFYSEYLDASQPVVAKGVFTKDGYPTYIRENGGVIEFSRDIVRAPVLFDLLPQITYESKDGKLNLAGGINFVLETITGLSLDDLIPKVYFRDDAWNFFTKRTDTAATLDSNAIAIDYNFNNAIPLHSVESVKDINIVVLAFGSVMLMTILSKAMFGLISRVFDLAMLFITYPVFAATLPLGDDRFKNWTKQFVGRIFGAYGIVIGLNLVFVLIPVLAGFEPIFTAEFVATNFRGSSLSPRTLATFMNLCVWLMFYLVLFTLIPSTSKTIGSLVGSDYDPIASGDEVVGGVKAVVEKTAEVVSGKFLIDSATKLAGDAKGFIPGGAAATQLFGKDARDNRKAKRAAKMDVKQRKAELESGSTETLDKRNKKTKEDADKAKAKEKKKKAAEAAKKPFSMKV